MAETLCKLVVALSLDSSNFPRNMRSINQQIKEAKSTFRLADVGVENFENGREMKKIDEMDMLGFLLLRARDTQREAEKKKPRRAFIDEVWSSVKP